MTSLVIEKYCIKYKGNIMFQFLHEVSKQEDRNKMSAGNLAIVITPNVVRQHILELKNHCINASVN